MHVVARCNNREFYFTTADDFALLLAHLRELVRKYEVTVYAYTLMPNHIHLLLQAPTHEALGRPLRWFMTERSGGIGPVGRDVANLRKIIFLTGTPQRRARAFPQEYGRPLLAMWGAMSKRAPKTIEAPLPAGFCDFSLDTRSGDDQ